MITSSTVQHTTDRSSARADSESAFALPTPLAIRGINVVPFDSNHEAVRCLAERISQRRKTFCVAINPEKVYRAARDPQLRAVLDKAEIGLCDGIGIVIGARILYGQKLHRCCGCDLFFDLMAAAQMNRWRVFLLGASPESSSAAVVRLGQMYPDLQLAGYRDGYFTDSAEVVREINDSHADLLFVALGSPRQEFWIAENQHAINAPFCMGVGGSLDVLSGAATRAPKVFRKTGTEFLFRLITNPGRWRRQLALPGFMVQVLKDKLLQRGKGDAHGSDA